VTGHPVLTNGVQWVKSTLGQCLNRHASCAITKEPILPNRALHIERLGSGDFCVKLREHNNERGRYTALSHCWGSQQACTTTSENLKAYKNCVPWEALPATFQDAIIFTLTLGVQYIWIDSLCIIQDNTNDWEVESSRMGDIYQNAYLTLAATAASNDSEGYFSVQGKQAQEFRLHPKNRDGSIMVREKIQHWQTRSARLSVKLFPVLTRGWVLQERYLSPRTLHFCSHELVWECLEDMTCECGGILADCDPLGRLQLLVNTAEPIDLQPSLSVIDGSGQILDQNANTQNVHSEVSAWNRAEPDLNHVTARMRFTTGVTTPCDPESNAEGKSGGLDKRSRSWTRARKKLSTSMQRIKRRDPGSNHNLYLNGRLGAPPDASTRPNGRNTNSQSPDAAHGDTNPLSPPSYEQACYEQQPTQYLEHISDQWHSIVEQYTPLKLSRETDRLPALSGLATLASSILGTYSCGLWLKTIAQDLLWRVPLLESGYSRPIKFTGRSWSWAAVDGQVIYWDDLDNYVEDDEIERLRYESYTLETWSERKEAIQALRQRLQERAARRQEASELEASCEVSLRGRNPFGEVNSGQLKISGLTRNARLIYVNSYGSAESTHVDRHDPLRYQLGIQTSQGSGRSFDLELPFFADYILSEGPDRVPEDSLVTLFSLRQNVCLVLTGGPREYRRIGIVRQSGGYWTYTI
jgi:hypothetical protein